MHVSLKLLATRVMVRTCPRHVCTGSTSHSPLGVRRAVERVVSLQPVKVDVLCALVSRARFWPLRFWPLSGAVRVPREEWSRQCLTAVHGSAAGSCGWGGRDSWRWPFVKPLPGR